MFVWWWNPADRNLRSQGYRERRDGKEAERPPGNGPLGQTVANLKQYSGIAKLDTNIVAPNWGLVRLRRNAQLREQLIRRSRIGTEALWSHKCRVLQFVLLFTLFDFFIKTNLSRNNTQSDSASVLSQRDLRDRIWRVASETVSLKYIFWGCAPWDWKHTNWVVGMLVNVVCETLRTIGCCCDCWWCW